MVVEWPNWPGWSSRRQATIGPPSMHLYCLSHCLVRPVASNLTWITSVAGKLSNVAHGRLSNPVCSQAVAKLIGNPVASLLNRHSTRSLGTIIMKRTFAQLVLFILVVNSSECRQFQIWHVSTELSQLLGYITARLLLEGEGGGGVKRPLHYSTPGHLLMGGGVFRKKRTILIGISWTSGRIETP